MLTLRYASLLLEKQISLQVGKGCRAGAGGGLGKAREIPPERSVFSLLDFWWTPGSRTGSSSRGLTSRISVSARRSVEHIKQHADLVAPLALPNINFGRVRRWSRGVRPDVMLFKQ